MTPPTRQPGICFVSSYKPRPCGIANFSRSIIRDLSQPDTVKIVAISEAADRYKYGKEVIAEIVQDDPETYVAAANAINADKSINVVSLQHVFSLFGGQHGENIISFLKTVKKPVITTLHIVYPNNQTPNKLEVVDIGYSAITERIVRYSTRVAVIIPMMADLLMEQYNLPSEKIEIIPHGSPIIKRHDPNVYKKKLGLGNGPIISSFGLIREKKGLEYAVRAMPQILEKYPKARLLILGENHPNRPNAYYQKLEKEADKLGLYNRSIFFRDQYLSFREIIEYLLATDVFITPYLVPEQTSSGAIAYAMGCGKAIISTPFAYAEEVLSNKRGLFINYRSRKSIFKAVDFLFSHPDKRERMEKRAYEYAKNNSFKVAAARYQDVFEEIAK